MGHQDASIHNPASYPRNSKPSVAEDIVVAAENLDVLNEVLELLLTPCHRLAHPTRFIKALFL